MITCLDCWRSLLRWVCGYRSTAQRRRIQRDELAWSGKRLHPDDLDSFIRDQRPAWRRKARR